ncbi:MAG TPA: DUF6084 family protein [Candidatus Dormibacteraeota bacterium]|jgi:hypothetical protein|nr:DUF6084 family protein [Candidatus Dormibacteraeota bacterium]
MPELNFQIEGAKPVPYGASPLLAFELRVTNSGPEPAIHTVVLRAQIQIEVTRRRYTPEEQAKLLDLFGEPSRWGQTLKNMLWTNAIVIVPGFEKETIAQLQVPCTFDFNVGATKYFHGLSEGDLPLNFLFSGTVFYADGNEQLQVAPISWEKEAKFKLPLKTWKDLIDHYYPNSAWLYLRRDVFDRLYQYKVRHGITSWEQVIERVLAGTEETVQL